MRTAASAPCELGLRVAEPGRARLVLLLRDRLALDEPAGAARLVARELERAARLRGRGLRAVELGLVGPRVDHEQERAGLDDLAGAERDRLEVAAHARAHLDRIRRLEPPRVVVPLEDLALDGVRDRDLRRGLLGGGIAAGGGEQEQQDCQGRASGRCGQGDS